MLDAATRLDPALACVLALRLTRQTGPRIPVADPPRIDDWQTGAWRVVDFDCIPSMQPAWLRVEKPMQRLTVIAMIDLHAGNPEELRQPSRPPWGRYDLAGVASL